MGIPETDVDKAVEAASSLQYVSLQLRLTKTDLTLFIRHLITTHCTITAEANTQLTYDTKNESHHNREI